MADDLRQLLTPARAPAGAAESLSSRFWHFYPAGPRPAQVESHKPVSELERSPKLAVEQRRHAQLLKAGGEGLDEVAASQAKVCRALNRPRFRAVPMRGSGSGEDSVIALLVFHWGHAKAAVQDAWKQVATAPSGGLNVSVHVHIANDQKGRPVLFEIDYSVDRDWIDEEIDN